MKFSISFPDVDYSGVKIEHCSVDVAPGSYVIATLFLILVHSHTERDAEMQLQSVPTFGTLTSSTRRQWHCQCGRDVRWMLLCLGTLYLVTTTLAEGRVLICLYDCTCFIKAFISYIIMSSRAKVRCG